MQTKINKWNLAIYSFSFIILFLILLSMRLKVDGQLYELVISPLKSMMESNPTLKIDLDRIILIRNDLKNYIDLVFSLIALLYLYSARPLTLPGKIATYSLLILLTTVFFLVPKIT